MTCMNCSFRNCNTSFLHNLRVVNCFFFFKFKKCFQMFKHKRRRLTWTRNLSLCACSQTTAKSLQQAYLPILAPSAVVSPVENQCREQHQCLALSWSAAQTSHWVDGSSGWSEKISGPEKCKVAKIIQITLVGSLATIFMRKTTTTKTKQKTLLPSTALLVPVDTCLFLPTHPIWNRSEMQMNNLKKKNLCSLSPIPPSLSLPPSTPPPPTLSLPLPIQTSSPSLSKTGCLTGISLSGV